jgi:hypothetical protein
MGKKAKIRFIRELVTSVEKSVIDRVGDMPEYWDGRELRLYIAEKFNDAAYARLRTSQMRTYKNELIVRNL